MASSMGQRQLRAFAERVQARLRVEASAPSLDQAGVLQLDSSAYVRKSSAVELPVMRHEHTL